MIMFIFLFFFIFQTDYTDLAEEQIAGKNIALWPSDTR